MSDRVRKKFRIPVWITAIVIGFLILEVITRVWSFMAIANIRSTPEVPWSVPVMLMVLWLAWKYLNGSWLPRSTQSTRRLWMRANRMEAGRRVWGWISGFLLGAVIIQLIVISTRAVDFPTGQIGLVEQIRIYPAWTVLPLIAMISLVAGITEEAAFRGYMQKPLEMHYGPKLAIVVVALLFTLIHLPNATVAPHLLPLFFFGSLGWGVLAYLTDSIIPGVVVHAVVDLIGFTWTWTYLDSARAMAAASVMRDGIDASFTILLATAFATTAALIVSFYKLSKVNE